MNWLLKNLKCFQKEEIFPKADLAILKTDIHSHLIPGIDDGVKTTEEAIQVIKELQLLGYEKLITTPHIMSDNYKNTPEIIYKGLQQLKIAIEKENIPIQIEAASEYYLDYEFEEKRKNNELLTFGDGYVLIELSFVNEPTKLFENIFELQIAGYKPVLAHPERYDYWYNQLDKFEELKSKGVFFQLNISSLTGYYSPFSKKMAEAMIDKEWIDFIGTDCHNMHYIKNVENTLQEKYLHKLLAYPNLLNNTL